MCTSRPNAFGIRPEPQPSIRSSAFSACVCPRVRDNGASRLCSTIRSFYINIFDFNVDVALVDDALGSGADFNGDKAAVCNSWSAKVVTNDKSAAQIALMNQALINNPTNNNNKVTSSYYEVTISLSNAPAGVTLANYKWRFLYSIPAFMAEGGSSSITATPTTALAISAFADNVFTGNNAVYVPASATSTYIFEVQTHNILGQLAPMIYSLQIDEVQLETGANTEYNNAEKLNAAVITAHSYTGRTALTDGTTGTRTISQSPATGVVTITE